MRTIAGVVVALASATAIAGCAKEIDNKDAEAFLTDSISKQTGSTIKAVSCPDGISLKRGDTFDCSVTAADGTSGTVTVTQTNGDGGVSISTPFLPIARLANQIAARLSEQVDEKVTLECPDLVKVEKGGRFDCRGTNGEKTRRIIVTQKDDKGNVKYTLR